MPITPRIFGERGRRRALALGLAPDRLPPGQSPTVKWPVLSVGPTPRVEHEAWTLLASQVEAWRGDIHCVTRWSKFGMAWRGLSVRGLLERARPLPEATHLMARADDGYTTNLPYHHRGDPWQEERYSVPDYVARARRREVRGRLPIRGD